MEKCEEFDGVGGYKENVRRNVRYLIELRAVMSFFEDSRDSIELRAVRRMLDTLRYVN